jgi:hypothetical protein
MPEETTQEGTGQTAGSDGADQTKEETYTKAQLTELMQKEIGKVTAKHSKKLSEIQAELDTERKKSLPDPEKIKLTLEEKDGKIKELSEKLSSIEVRQKKHDALEAAKLNLPENVTLTDLLELMPGSEEDIPAHLERFKKMFPARSGLGTATTTGEKGTGPDIDAQIAEAEKDGDWQLSVKLRNSKYKM